MPTRALRACPRPSCHHVQPCPAHARKPWGGTSQRQRLGVERVPEATRLLVLRRDGYLCQIQGPACTGKATQVDHILALARGGTNEADNLRAACAGCNHRRNVGERGAA